MNESGILLVRKPVGISSYDVIRILKRKFHPNKIGHAGTLDPFASGLMIVALNEATKILPFLETENKEYIGELTLGEAHDTFDITGKIIKKKKPKKHSKEEIQNALESFLGKYIQTPPIYSALKLHGKPLYKYARENKKVEIKKREQNIYKVRLIKVKGNKIIFYVKCDKGTYIRVFGFDLASRLNEVGYLSNLERIGIGDFYILNVKKAESITMKDLIPIQDALKIRKFEVKNIEKVKNGNPIKLKNIDDENVLILHNKKPLAIYYLNKKDMLYYSKRGFNYESL